MKKQEEKFWEGRLTEQEEDTLRGSGKTKGDLDLYFRAMDQLKSEYEEKASQPVPIPRSRSLFSARIISIAATFTLLVTAFALMLIYGPGQKQSEGQARVMTMEERVAMAKALAIMEDKYTANLKMTSDKIDYIQESKNKTKLKFD